MYSSAHTHTHAYPPTLSRARAHTHTRTHRYTDTQTHLPTPRHIHTYTHIHTPTHTHTGHQGVAAGRKTRPQLAAVRVHVHLPQHQREVCRRDSERERALEREFCVGIFSESRSDCPFTFFHDLFLYGLFYEERSHFPAIFTDRRKMGSAYVCVCVCVCVLARRCTSARTLSST